MKLRKLGTTLTIAFLSVCAIVMLMNGIINIYYSFMSNQKVVFNEQQLIASYAANEVKNFIHQKNIMLESVGNVNNLLTVDSEEQKHILGKLLGLDSSFRQIVLVDEKNRELARVSRLSKLSRGQLTEENEKEAIAVTDEGVTYTSNVYVDETTFEPIIIVAVPMKNSIGDKTGTIFAEINLKFMWDLIGSLKVGEGGTAYVVDSEGTLIAFEDAGRVIKGEKLLGIEEVLSFVQNKERGDNKVQYTKGILGNNVLSSYVPLNRPEWAVFVEVPALEAAKPIIESLTISIIVMVFSLVLALIISIFISKRITRPIIELKDAAKIISKGKLDTEIRNSSNNEIGELAAAFNQMVSNINTLIMNVKQASRVILERSSTLKESAEQSAASSEAIVCAMDQISRGADDQAREAEKTSEHTNVLGEEIDSAVSKAIEVEKITEDTKDLSVKSKDTVELLIQRAQETDRVTRLFIENTKRLSSSLEKIRDIAVAISTITNKTKTLSLNARIEAARAGEAGRGFVVIVNEISNLADQSGDAAKMIDPILKEIQFQAEVSKNTSEQAIEIVEEQMQTVLLTQSAFDEIILSMENAISHIIGLNQTIKKIDIFKQQSIGAVMTISSITQETAASCEEVSATSLEQKEIADEVKAFASSLYDMGEKLVETIGAFKTKEG